MDRDAMLVPLLIRGQSGSAISGLQVGNDALQYAKTAINAVIDDRTNRASCFDNFRNMMEDYLTVLTSLERANDVDIAEHRVLRGLVGSGANLEGWRINDEYDYYSATIRTARTNIDYNQGRADGFRHGSMRRALYLTARDTHQRTYDNAVEMTRYLRGKMDAFILIENATRNMFVLGNALRATAMNGLRYIEIGAEGLPDSYNTPELYSWRNDVELMKEHISIENHLNDLFNDLIERDVYGNIIDVNWDAVEQLDPSIQERIIDKFIRDMLVYAGTWYVAGAMADLGLVTFLNNMTVTVSGQEYVLGFKVTPYGLVKFLGYGILIVGTTMTFVNELRSGENLENAILYTGGIAGIAWSAKWFAGKVAAGAKKGGLATGPAAVFGAIGGAVVAAVASTIYRDLYNEHVRERVNAIAEEWIQGNHNRRREAVREAFGDLYPNNDSAFEG